MKKILVCDKGTLKEWYGQADPDGFPLRLRRLTQAGRLEFVQVTNDPPPYWFVMVRNFDMSENGPDRVALKGLTTPWGNGVWRFLDVEKAKAKFKQLAALPIFVTEAAHAQKLRDKRKEQILKVGRPLPKRSEGNTA